MRAEALSPPGADRDLRLQRMVRALDAGIGDHRRRPAASRQTDRPAVHLPDGPRDRRRWHCRRPLPPINQGCVFSPERALQSWVEKEKHARRLGFDGLRVSGDTSWLGVLFQDEKPIAWNHEIWSSLARYENRVGQLMQTGAGPRDPHPHMLALCTYDLEQCSPVEIIEASTNHELTLIRTDGNCRDARAGEDIKVRTAGDQTRRARLAPLARDLQRQLRPGGRSVGGQPEELPGAGGIILRTISSCSARKASS